MKPETEDYLKPILEAATLLELPVYPHNVEQLGAVLDRIARGYPRDVLPRLEALRVLAGGIGGTVEELEILEKVWPDYSGDKRYKLAADRLTWTWSSKHSGRYARITVPFPTILPMVVTVERFCDMDDEDNHGEGCDGDNCHCEGFVEQEVEATVKEWDEQTERQLGHWLADAVVQHVEPATFPAAEDNP